MGLPNLFGSVSDKFYSCAVPTKKEKQPLSVTHPELAKESEGWDPTEFTQGSPQKVSWKCQVGHIYNSAISSRTSKNRGCPFCAGQKVWPGFNDFASRYPELAGEAYGWDPQLVTKSSARVLKWQCPLGHKYEAAVSSRGSGRGCPVCSGRKVLKGFNDLKTTHPEIASQANGWDPSTVSKGSNKVQSWRCPINHTWEIATNNRTGQRSGCPVCSNNKVVAGYNDLATTHSELAKQLYEDDATLYVAGSEKIVSWMCELGHIYRSSIANRANGSGCIVCNGKQVLAGFNDLASLFPVVAAQAHGWDPATVTAHSQRNLEWVCSNGHFFKRKIANRTSRENRCPVCSGHKVLKGFNDLASTYPALAAEAHEWDPTTVSAGSGKKVSWRCPIGHIYLAQVANRAGRGDLCPFCSGNQVLAGFNDLQTTHPELSKELNNPKDALEVSSGSDKKLEWKCPKNHKWKAAVSNRKAGNGCPSCAESGFDPNSEAYLYFLAHENWGMFQIGITNVPKKRLRVHKYLGWNLLELRGPMDGHLTQQWETAILRMLKAKGADLSNNKIAGKFDGYSEAWSKSKFEVKSIKELMRLTEEFEKPKKDPLI